MLAYGVYAFVEGGQDFLLIGGGVGDFLQDVGQAVVVDVVALELFAYDLQGFGLDS